MTSKLLMLNLRLDELSPKRRKGKSTIIIFRKFVQLNSMNGLRKGDDNE